MTRLRPAAVAVLSTALVLATVIGGDAVATAGTATLAPRINPLTGVAAGAIFNSISCVAASSCVGVGSLGSPNNPQPVVLVGDPATWSAASAHEIQLGAADGSWGYLSAVTCATITSCVAVGSDLNHEPLVFTGNPSTWGPAQAKQINLGSPFGSGGSLNSITCSLPTQCVAAGSDLNGEPLTLSGNPLTWTPAQARQITLGVSFGGGGTLYSIACESATACVAVGRDLSIQPLALVGDPATWTVAQANEITLGPTFANGGELYGVSCTTALTCVAVGFDDRSQPLVITGNPTTWSESDSLEVTLGSAFGGGGQLYAVTCFSAVACTAEGGDATGEPITISGDPATWAAADASQTNLGPTFDSSGYFTAEACTTSTTCAAVGRSLDGQSFVQVGNPGAWSAADAHQVVLDGAALNASVTVNSLVCPTASFCVAVGFTNAGYVQPFVITGNPASWSTAHARQLNLGRTSTYGGQFSAIRCFSTTNCVAVGNDYNGRVLTWRGNPSAWTTSSVRSFTLGPSSAGSGYITGLACSSATSCVAVGYDGSSEPLSLSGNPATWGLAQVRRIVLGATFGHFGHLRSVSCTSSTSCLAVGYDSRPGVLTVRGNPSTWGVAQARHIAFGSSFGSGADLESVTCTSATVCIGVGYSNVPKPMVMVGNPATWSASQARQVVVTPALASTVTGEEVGPSSLGVFWSLSCVSSTNCVAVGDDGVGQGGPLFIAGNPAHWSTQSTTRPLKLANFQTAIFTATACVGSTCYAGGQTEAGTFLAVI